MIGAAQAYIDLARRGRTGVWPFVQGLLWLIGAVILMIILAGMGVAVFSLHDPALLTRLQRLPTGGAGIGFELAFIAAQAFVVLLGIILAVRVGQRRAMSTLLSHASRLDTRRLLAGILAWAAATVVTGAFDAVISALLALDKNGTAAFAMPSLDDLVIAVLAGALIVPVQAAGEELVFRGWLTQSIGQWIRQPAIVVAIVAVLFAALHLQSANPVALVYYMIASISFSVLTLRDGHLEPAIGAHTAQNLFVLVVATPFLTAGHQPTLFGAGAVEIGGLAVASVILQAVVLNLTAPWMISRLARRLER